MGYTGDLRINIAYPSPYDESLSYLEYLGKLHTKINELIDLINSYESNYMTYTDEQINLLKDELDGRFTNITQLIDNTDQALRSVISTQYTTITNETASLINLNVNTLNQTIVNQVALLNSRITTEINNLMIYIDSGFITLKVLNPVTGQQSSIQDALNSLAEQFRTDALTCLDYDALNITASGYDALDLTAYEYDYNGITI